MIELEARVTHPALAALAAGGTEPHSNRPPEFSVSSSTSSSATSQESLSSCRGGKAGSGAHCLCMRQNCPGILGTRNKYCRNQEKAQCVMGSLSPTLHEKKNLGTRLYPPNNEKRHRSYTHTNGGMDRLQHTQYWQQPEERPQNRTLK